MFKGKLTYRNRSTIIGFCLVFAIVGSILLVATHAQTPTASLEPEQGSLSGNITTGTDSTASGNAYVQFGNSGSSSSLAPMELVNRLSGVKIYPSSAAAASDSDYSTSWDPGNSGTISYDLSAVPAANRSQLLVAWYTELEDGYSAQVFMNGDCINWQRPIPTAYTIDVNSAAGGGSAAPTSGWVNAVSVSNNIYFSRQHLINMINPSTGTPYNWIRMNVTNAIDASGNDFDINIDLADASQGVTDDWLFIGDSITTRYAGHSVITGGGQNIGPGIADLVSSALGNSYHLITQNAGVACTKSTDWGNVYSAFSSSPTLNNQLSIFPGKYVTLNLGTNDMGNNDPSGFYTSMNTLVQTIINAGKVPVIPQIPWPNGGYSNSTAQAYNAEINQLYQNYPAIIKGPDLYNLLLNKPSSWFDAAGNVHPTGAGLTAVRCAWAYAIDENVYGVTPSPISSCNGFASP